MSLVLIEHTEKAEQQVYKLGTVVRQQCVSNSSLFTRTIASSKSIHSHTVLGALDQRPARQGMVLVKEA